MRSLRHPLYLLALLILLANDHLWKAAYGNAVTGKLSDFAGLFIFAVFAQLVWRRMAGSRARQPGGILLAGLFFVWFKSPFSGLLLMELGEWTGIPFGRTVDPTDLLALLVLYPAWRMVREQLLPKWPRLPRAAAVVTVLPLSLFAFVATSVDDDLEYTVAQCCYTQVGPFAVGSGTLYIPNAFTPDRDGINDIFRVIADSNIVRLDSVVIYSNTDFQPVYQAYDVMDFTSGPAFTGDGLDSLPPQVFYVLVTATSRDSVTQSFSVDLCALPCDQPTDQPVPTNVDLCVFNNQISPAGVDTTADSGERLECFK